MMAWLKNPLARLTAATGVSALLYWLVFTRPFLLGRYYALTPPLDYTKLTGYASSATAAFIGAVIALTLIYVVLLRWDRTPTLPQLAPYSGLLFAFILLFSYPTLAIDLLIYAVRARIWRLYDLNPLAATPDSLPPTDTWAPLAAEWGDIASPYGPLWETISVTGLALVGNDLLAHLFVFKLIAIVSYAGSIVLIGLILEHLQPTWKTVGMFAFAWNPLVLLETAQNGHNDILMVFLTLAAIWAMVANHPLWVMPFLALAVQIKFVPLLLAPVLILHLALQSSTWRQRLTTVIVHSLIFIILVIGPMLPLWPGWDQWAVLDVGAGAGRSLLALSILTLSNFLDLNLAFDLSRILLNGLFGVIVLVGLWQQRNQLQSRRAPIFLSWLIFFWYVLLAIPVFHAWYILWSLPLAILLLPEQKALQATILFSLTALLIIPYFETIRVWYPVLLENHLLGHAIGVPLLVGPPVLLLIVSRWIRTPVVVNQMQP